MVSIQPQATFMKCHGDKLWAFGMKQRDGMRGVEVDQKLQLLWFIV